MPLLLPWRRAPEDGRVASNPNSLAGSAARGAVVASGARAGSSSSGDNARLTQGWQNQVWFFYDELAPVNFAAQFYARMLSKLRLYIAEEDENGDLVESENAEVKPYLDRIQDPGGGRSVLLSSYGRLIFLVGEAILFVTKDIETDREQWEMLSSDEIRVIGGVYSRYKAPELGAEEYRAPVDDDYSPIEGIKEAQVYRLWKRHPRYSSYADSTMRSVLDLCEELRLLTLAVRARARSRLAGSGILFLDERISKKPPEPVGDEDPAEDIYLRDFTNAMTAPLQDEGASSAVVPMLTRVTVPEGMTLRDMVYHLQVVDPTQLYPEIGLRDECVRRIALGVDMPAEILLGLEESNHWTAWVIQQETWVSHGEPVAQQLCDDLTSSYLRPTLKAKGFRDWDKYSIAFDASKIVNHPSRLADSLQLYDRRVVGKKTVRDAGGFADDDAMTQEEINESIGVAVRDSMLAISGEPSSSSGQAAAPEEAPVGPSTVEKAPPAPPDSTTGSGNGNGHSSELAVRLVGAAGLCLLRCRELAGNRIRNYAKRDAEALALIEGVPSGQIAATLGSSRVRELTRGIPERELVAGSRELIQDALRIWRFRRIDEVASLVAEKVELHAARTLYQEKPLALPVQFESHVRSLVAASEES